MKIIWEYDEKAYTLRLSVKRADSTWTTVGTIPAASVEGALDLTARALVEQAKKRMADSLAEPEEEPDGKK